MTTADDVLNTIRYYLGVAENPAHSNQTIIGEKFSRLSGADAGNAVPWCAETVSVCQREAGNAGFQVSASCSTLVARYRDGTNGTWLGNPGLAGLLPGDEFFLGSYGQDHTGLVETVDASAVVTVEGNWGDRVARVTRPIGAFYGFGRPRYNIAPSQGGNEVTQEQMDALIKEIRDNAIAVASDVKSTKVDVETANKRIDQVNQRLDTIIAKLGK